MLTRRRLNGVEQLEQKQMLTTLLESPVAQLGGSGAMASEGQTSFTPDYAYAGLMDAPQLCPILEGDGQTSFAALAPAPEVLGDVNGDGAFDQADLDELVASGKYSTGLPASESEGDVDGDGDFDQLDLVQIQVAAKYNQPTSMAGDANRDGAFNQLDIMQLLQEDKYMKDEPADWGSGDFNGDGRFDQIDLVLALQEGNYDVTGQAALGGAPLPGLPLPGGDEAMLSPDGGDGQGCGQGY